MRRLLRRTAIAAFLCLAPFAEAQQPDDLARDTSAGIQLSQADREFFEKSVRPVLIERCQDCHNSDNAESDLSVEHLADLLKGGTRGPAIVPGKPEQSLVIRALSHGDVELQMPPKAKIPLAEIAAITDWIRRGAFWPGEEGLAPPSDAAAGDQTADTFTDEQRNFWAFRTPVAPPLPPVRQRMWVQSPIDHFVLSRLEAEGMEPAPAADKRTLIRRISLDLLGLPPTPDEIAEFLSDDAPDAIPRLIDRCLASPRYGERWGRYWLDVARYGDSNGLDENLAHANAFRYRDYVIAAFNADKPYAEFVHEQLAGDLLNADPQTATDDVELLTQRLVATGFLSLGAKMLAEDDPVKMQMDIIDEQVDTLGKAFMGLTLGCGRCHDHKFDPFTQRDYYGLAGIFKSTRTMENFNVVARWQEVPLGAPSEIEHYRRQQALVDQQNEAIAAFRAQSNTLVLETARGQLDRYLLAVRRAELIAGLTAARPQGDTVTAAADRPAGVHLLEAEQFARGNVGVHTSGYGEGIGVLVNQGELPNAAEYDLEIAQPGWYQFEARYAAAESRPVRVAHNGRVVMSQALAQTTGTWYPDTQTWHIAGFIELAAGANVLRLERDGPFPHLDKLLLVPVAADVAASLAEVGPADDGSPLQSVFIDRWRTLLGGALAADSPLLPAQRAFQGRPAEEWFKDLPRDVLDLFTPHPASLADLAASYAALLRNEDTSASGIARLRSVIDDPHGPFKLPENPDSLYPPAQQAELKELQDELAEREAAVRKLPEAMAVSDATPENLRIHYRGSHLNLGPETPRVVPAIFRPTSQTEQLGSANHSGRLELARWLTQPAHPLTSRVMVNRVWLWHFGKGLVRSPDNFGLLGEAPTHPELLDWLAVEFIRSGWSLKDLHRLILMSSAYQMSTQYRADYDESDPENKLLWRMNRRRLDAEAIRDSILAAADALDDQMQGSLLPTANRAYVTSTANVSPEIYDSDRRSVYLPVVRSALFDMFQAFDFADPTMMNGQRDSTTVASQALFMMNSRFVEQNSARLAAAVAAPPDLSPAARVALLFERVVGRKPSADETAGALAYVADYTPSSDQAPATDASASQATHAGWHSLCRILISSNEFLYVE